MCPAATSRPVSDIAPLAWQLPRLPQLDPAFEKWEILHGVTHKTQEAASGHLPLRRASSRQRGTRSGISLGTVTAKVNEAEERLLAADRLPREGPARASRINVQVRAICVHVQVRVGSRGEPDDTRNQGEEDGDETHCCSR